MTVTADKECGEVLSYATPEGAREVVINLRPVRHDSGGSCCEHSVAIDVCARVGVFVSNV